MSRSEQFLPLWAHLEPASNSWLPSSCHWPFHLCLGQVQAPLLNLFLSDTEQQLGNQNSEQQREKSLYLHTCMFSHLLIPHHILCRLTSQCLSVSSKSLRAQPSCSSGSSQKPFPEGWDVVPAFQISNLLLPPVSRKQVLKWSV